MSTAGTGIGSGFAQARAWWWGLGCALLALSAPFWVADADAASGVTRRGEQAESMLAALDDAVWVADGPASARHVYVLYSTDCALSKAFFEQSRTLREQVQLRWIALGGDNAAAVLTRMGADQDADTVKASFSERLPAPADGALFQRAFNINHWAIQAQNLNRVRFPTLIYATEQGAQVNSGGPESFQALEAAVRARPERASYRSAAQQWLQTMPGAEASDSPIQRTISSQARPLVVYPVPDQNSRVAARIRRDAVYSVLSVIGNEWLKVDFGRLGDQPVQGFVRAPGEIRAAQLQFEVEPASGEVISVTDALEMRLYPSEDAPVVMNIRRGYAYERTGTVRVGGAVWSQVLAFNDGTHGYVRQ